MANLLPFFPSAAFDHNATRAMGKAFDRACDSLHDIGQPDLVREIIAKRIVEVARDGERDPDELCVRALKALGFSSFSNRQSLIDPPPQLTAFVAHLFRKGQLPECLSRRQSERN